MPPFRVEYLCLYRPVWRWDGGEHDYIRDAVYEALTFVAGGRQARIIDARDECLWQS